MDLNAVLVGGKCECARVHACNIKYVYIESDAYRRFADICTDYKNILLVADENTFAAAGESVECALDEKNVNKLIFSGEKILIPNEKAVEKVESCLECIDFIIAIGSGVLQDICKYVSYRNNVPYAVAATAPSMDGYASNGAAMIYGGMKTTFSAVLPVAIVADTKVLRNAPTEMIKAGYGDIIGKYSALNDWKLSHIVNGEYFCRYIYDTTYNMIEETMKHTEGILACDEKSIGILMEALVVVGIMMSFAGSSRPASGSEHHLSHFFEIVGILTDSEYFPHGIDVAYSTYITAKIRKKILENEFKDKPYTLNVPKNEIKQVYSGIADECIKLQEKTGNYAKDRTAVYKINEQEVREVLKEMPSPEDIEKILNEIGLDLSDFYQMYGDEKIAEAVKYAKDLKDRYTVLWMNYDFFGGEYE